MKLKNTVLFLLIVLIFTGCEILPFLPTADITLTFNPNPAYDPYYTSTYGWTWDVNVRIRETENINITLGNYGPGNAACISKFLTANNQVVSTDIFYANDIEEFFGTLEISGNASISHDATFSSFTYDEGKFVETYYGIDENGVIVSCTDTLILINNTKK